VEAADCEVMTADFQVCGAVHTPHIITVTIWPVFMFVLIELRSKGFCLRLQQCPSMSDEGGLVESLGVLWRQPHRLS